MIEKYSCYEFEIIPQEKELYSYKIFGSGCPPYDDGVIESDDYFDSEVQARFAAIGHISILEEGPEQ